MTSDSSRIPKQSSRLISCPVSFWARSIHNKRVDPDNWPNLVDLFTRPFLTSSDSYYRLLWGELAESQQQEWITWL